MNITKENIDELNAVIKIKITPEDYKAGYENEIKKHQRNAALPGFRQGKAPASLVRKMVGKSVLAEALNKITSDSLFKFLEDNKVHILGHPLPKPNPSATFDWDNPKDFEFLYELGLSPQFEA